MPQHASQETIDRLVREVLRRLKQRPTTGLTAETNESSETLAERVITAAMIAGLPKTHQQLVIHPQAIVTPAARDEARGRNITIERTTHVTPHAPTTPTQMPAGAIDDARDPSRGEAVARQLVRRGVGLPKSKVMLSETPGRDVYEQCSQHDERAVMVTAVTDVDRYLTELEPTCWVLDMTRLNLIAAVNVVARITQREGAHR